MNMESYNVTLIKENLSQSERLVKLNQMAINQMQVLDNLNGPLLNDKK
ncbi:MAG: hypothetical protein ACI4TX_02195 [Christensenellales bacterium]